MCSAGAPGPRISKMFNVRLIDWCYFFRLAVRSQPPVGFLALRHLSRRDELAGGRVGPGPGCGPDTARNRAGKINLVQVVFSTRMLVFFSFIFAAAFLSLSCYHFLIFNVQRCAADAVRETPYRTKRRRCTAYVSASHDRRERTKATSYVNLPLVGPRYF